MKIALRSLLALALGACGSDPSSVPDASIDAGGDVGPCGPMPSNSSWPLCRPACSYLCGQQCSDICSYGGCWTCADGGWQGTTYDCVRDCGTD